MGIHLGGVEITEANGIFLGDTAISEVFLGSTKVWPDESVSTAGGTIGILDYGQHYGILYANENDLVPQNNLFGWALRARRSGATSWITRNLSRGGWGFPRSQASFAFGQVTLVAYDPALNNVWQLQSQWHGRGVGAFVWGPTPPAEILITQPPDNFTLAATTTQITITSGTVPVWTTVSLATVVVGRWSAEYRFTGGPWFSTSTVANTNTAIPIPVALPLLPGDVIEVRVRWEFVIRRTRRADDDHYWCPWSVSKTVTIPSS